MNSLQLPLKANGVFSLLSGILLTAAPSTVGDWLGVDANLILRLLGVALLGHGAGLLWAASRPTPRPFLLANFFAITPYPLAMIGLVATGIIDTGTGRALVLADGLVIAVLAFWHLRELRRSSGGSVAIA